MELLTLPKIDKIDGHGSEAFHEYSFVDSLVKTKAFRRLKNIRFLGAIDYLFKPNGFYKRHNRYDHSLGVAYLALESFRYLELSKKDEEHIIAASLLHDIGHAPLSHSLEPIFRNEFGIDHHEATKLIICGEVGIGKDVQACLSESGLDSEKILALISGDTSAKGHELFNSQFNIDTLDGITRSAFYVYKNKLSIPAKEVLFASLRRNSEDRNKLDGFWSLKGQLYSHLIQGAMGLIADTVAQTIFSRSLTSSDKEAFFLGEDELIKKCPSIFNALEALSNPFHIKFDDEISVETYYNKNSFIINPQYSHSDVKNENKRYQRKKQRQNFTIEKNSVSHHYTTIDNSASYMTSGSFNDDRIRKQESFF